MKCNFAWKPSNQLHGSDWRKTINETHKLNWLNLPVLIIGQIMTFVNAFVSLVIPFYCSYVCVRSIFNMMTLRSSTLRQGNGRKLNTFVETFWKRTRARSRHFKPLACKWVEKHLYFNVLPRIAFIYLYLYINMVFISYLKRKHIQRITHWFLMRILLISVAYGTLIVYLASVSVALQCVSHVCVCVN